MKTEPRLVISGDEWSSELRAMPGIVEYHELLAANGNPQAATVLGDLHLHGAHGVPQDFVQARQLFEMAIENRQPAAYSRFGRMYLDGLGVPQDNDTARKLFEDGVELGDSDSMNALGYMYAHGIGVTVDSEYAYDLFLQSAKLGNSDGQLRVGMALLCMFLAILFWRLYLSLPPPNSRRGSKARCLQRLQVPFAGDGAGSPPCSILFGKIV